jgi:hypothetical protein
MLTAGEVSLLRGRSWFVLVLLCVLGCTGAAEFVDASSPAKVLNVEPAPSASADRLDAGTD